MAGREEDWERPRTWPGGSEQTGQTLGWWGGLGLPLAQRVTWDKSLPLLVPVSLSEK